MTDGLVLGDSSKTTAFDFEFHYDDRKTTREILGHILANLASSRIERWDNSHQPMKTLAADVRRYLAIVGPGGANELADHTTIIDVSISNGHVIGRPVISDARVPTKRYFFLSKANSPDQTSEPWGNLNVKPPWTRGCIIKIEESALPVRRSPLLLLHASCLRLQNEDPAFIKEFIQSHVGFQHRLNTPGPFQPMTASDTDASTMRCYRRLSYSFHIPHFVLEEIIDLREADCVQARGPASFPSLKLVGPFQPVLESQSITANTIKDQKALYQVSSSALLTFFLPEVSTSRQEETSFLTAPGVFWTLLTVNCDRSLSRSSWSLDSRNQPTIATPVAQFLRAMSSAMETQRIDERNILMALKDRLAELDSREDHLFDDENFTKSHLYHWAVQVCDQACHSISSTTRFISRISEDFLNEMKAKVHASESPEAELWSRMLAREAANLEELREEFLLCRQNVQERRNALHGATSVLVARLAIQQGERIKVLTYLAILYLPLSTSAGIFSINPLPESATLASFSIFLVVLSILTIGIGIGMATLRTLAAAARWIPKVFKSRPREGDTSLGHLEYLPGYFEYLEAVFTPPTSAMDGSGNRVRTTSPQEFFRPPAARFWGSRYRDERANLLKRAWFAVLLFSYWSCHGALHWLVIPWMAWPRTLLYRVNYIRWARRNRKPGAPAAPYNWNPLSAVRDAVAILLSPVAVVLFLGLTALLVAMDIIAWICHRGLGLLWEVIRPFMCHLLTRT